MSTKAKDKAHRQKQEKKMWGKGIHDGIEISLLASYATLVEHFGFDQDKVEKFNLHFQQTALYVLSETMTREDIEGVLRGKGVDLSIVGNSNIEKVRKLKDAVM